MFGRPPRPTLTDTLFPYTPLCRSRASFNAGHARLHRELIAARRMTRRLAVMRHRLEAVKARTGTREWQVKRRERTRQLIELGGLVVKAELVELADDDRALDRKSTRLNSSH